MIISCKFGMDVIAFYYVKVYTFFVVLKNLHCVVYGAKGVCIFIQVFGKF